MKSADQRAVPVPGKLYRHRLNILRHFELYGKRGSLERCVEGEHVLVLSVEWERPYTRANVCILRPDGTIGRSAFYTNETSWSGWWDEVT